jgi:flagellar FliL protein
MAKETAAAEQPKKSPLMLIVVILLLLIIAGGGFFAWTMLNKNNADSSGGNNKTVSAETKGPGIIIPVNAFIVNLMDRSGLGKRYLKITMQFEVSSQEQVLLVGQHKTRMRDASLMLLSSITFDDINTLDGKLELKQALIQRLNQILGDQIIRQLYFTEFVVQ